MPVLTGIQIVFGESPTTGAVGTTNAEGSSTNVARADHQHGFSGAAPADEAIASTAATGTATGFARSDHIHGMPGVGTPVTQAFSDAAGAGTAATLPRSDHRHGMPAAASVERVGATTDATTTSTTFVDLTTMTLTLNIPTSRFIYWGFSAEVSSDSNGARITFINDVGGNIANTGRQTNKATAGQAAVTASQYAVAGAGVSTTYKIQWSTSVGIATTARRTMDMLISAG